MSYIENYIWPNVKRVFAVFALAALVVGLPVLLWSLIGWPLPHVLPSWAEMRDTLTQSGIPDETLLDAIAVVCWLLWLAFAAATTVETIAVIRGGVARRIAVLTPMQVFAASLVSIIALSTPSGGRKDAPVALGAYVQAAQAPAVTLAVTATPPHEAPAVVASPVIVETKSYTVVRHDTLWGIAEKHLNDPRRWPEIFELNKNRPQPDGRKLVNADRIRPGWVLRLPGDATGLGETSTQVETTPDVSQVAQEVTKPQVTATPSPQDATPGTESGAYETPAAEVTSTAEAPKVEEVTGETESEDSVNMEVMLSASLIAGVGSALGLLRLRRRRKYQLKKPTPGIAWSEPGVDAHVRNARREELGRQLDAVEADDDSIMHLVPGAVADLLAQPFSVRSFAEARAIAMDALLSDECELVIDERIIADVFGKGPRSNAVNVIASDRLLVEFDAAVLTRTRLLRDADKDTMTEYREAFAGEPMSVKVFVVSSDSMVCDKWMTKASAAQVLDIAVIAVDVAGVPDGDAPSLEIEPTASFVELSSAVEREATNKPAEETTAEPFEAPQPTSGANDHVSVSVFGSVRVIVGGVEVKNELRGKAREMLTFLALRPQGATWEAVSAALWPEANGRRANQRFRTTLSNLRTTMRDALGREEKFVELVGERYVLDANVFDCDIWRFENALMMASESGVDAAIEIDALQTVRVDYRGDLAEDSFYEWVEAPREDIRRRALDALGRLAELQQSNGDATAALATLERAIAIDPYVEELYQRVMSIHAVHGRRDAVVRTYRALERRLEEIDVEPTERTAALLRELAA